MLDPRLYRTGLVAVALAVIVFAFSLQDQPSALTSTLAPSTFNGQNAFATMSSLSGGADGAAVADRVDSTLGGYGYAVRETRARLQTDRGAATVTTVTGTLAGNSPSAIVLVAALPPPRARSATALSGVGVLLELARVLHGESPNHTLIIAFTSDPAGVAPLAAGLPGPVDAVIDLGDLAAGSLHQPLVVPWSHRLVLAPLALRRTVAGALAAQAGLHTVDSGLGGQILHLAFPMTLSGQAPFDDLGLPAVLLSLTGEHASPAAGPLPPVQGAAAQARIAAVGRAVLQATNALDAGPQLAPPSSYLLYAGKVIPFWSVRLLVLALLLPVILTMVDALARVRRRGHAVGPWIAWVLCGSFGFLLAALVIALSRMGGLLSGAPGGPQPGGHPGPPGGAVAALVLAGLALVLGLFVVGPRLARLAGARRLRGLTAGEEPGAAIAVVLVLLLTTLVVWWRSPYAALLLVPALHLWLWLSATDLPLPRFVKLPLVALGVLAPAGAVVYYALAADLSPLGVLWNGFLMIARGQLGSVTVVLWSIAFGCLASVLAVACMPGEERTQEPVAITMRGPVSYAGPGSLGGTKSALRR